MSAKKHIYIKGAKENNLKNIDTRGGSVLVNEFEDIQEEYFRVQQDMYQIIQDAQAAGLSNFQIKKILRKRKMPSREVRKLMKGQFIPYKYNKNRYGFCLLN